MSSVFPVSKVEPVVRGITLTIPDGCFVGITGAAGGRKSTLTYAINGIIPHCYPGDFYGSPRWRCDTVDTSLTDLSRLVGSVSDIDSQMVSRWWKADLDSLRPGELRGAT